MLDIFGIKAKAAVALLTVTGCIMGGEGIAIALKAHEVQKLRSTIIAKDEQLTANVVNLKTCQSSIDDQNQQITKLSSSNEALRNNVTAMYDKLHTALPKVQNDAAMLLQHKSDGTVCQQMNDTDTLILGMLK